MTSRQNNYDPVIATDLASAVTQLRVAGIQERDVRRHLDIVLGKRPPFAPVVEYQERLRRIQAGELACLSLPWPMLATLTRLGAPGRLTTIAGRQGAAKSIFALQLLRYWLHLGVSASAYLLEGDMGELMDRTLAQVSGVSDVTDIDWQKANTGRMWELTGEHRADLDRVAAAVTVSAGLGLETLEDLAAWIEGEAKCGQRAIIADPVSAAMRKAQPWISDPAFVRRVKRAAIDHECSIICVTHLVKGADEGKPDMVAGSAAYGRFSDCVLQIIRHDKKASMVTTPVGRKEIEHSHTIYIEKTRNGSGSGCRLAMQFDAGSLTVVELGLITKKGTGK
ncbi:MAG: DnaB-like helicase C-terminal domain-containing protein [Sedimentisphaerales bacterium]|jgi:hypothetical protein|nr:DnaB-like helicase C-terminal domain-containing protein [Sedimentisphaerales bacterium]